MINNEHISGLRGLNGTLPPSRPWNPPATATIPLFLLFLQVGIAHATVNGPYTPDADTLHLWHMNEHAAPVIDLGSDGLHLTALRNGATLGNGSYKGFGTALSTYDGGPDAVTDVGRDAYLSARPLVNGLGDNVTMSYAGPSGAFTLEAILRIDFDPQTNFGTNSPGNGRGSFMQIINLDADEGTNRVCQFRLAPIGVLKGNTQPLLEFINLNRDKSPQSLTVAIPTSGSDAINFSGWYHVAVTYNGVPNQPDNLKFYWTLLDASRTTANLVGTGEMANNLPAGCAADFAIGQTGRQSPFTAYPNNNFVGLIDEVRMSGVARSASQMLFGGTTLVASAPPAQATEAARDSATQRPHEKPHDGAGETQEKSNDRWSGAVWLIAGALLVMAGFLGWLAFAFKRLASKGVGTAQSAVGYAVAAGVPDRVVLAAGAVASPEPRERTFATEHVRRQPEPQHQAGSDFPRSSVLNAANGRSQTAGEFQPDVFVQAPRVAADGRRHAGENPEPNEAGGEATSEVGFRGVLRKVGLQDIIQMECLSRKSSILEITNNNTHGRIYIEFGEIIHATFGELSGEEALNKLLSLPGGEFSLKAFDAPEKHTITGPWIQLLMEAARGRDECTVPAPDGREMAFEHSNSDNSKDILTLAGGLAELPNVKEVLVCSTEGKTLYSSKCEDAAGRQNVCSCLLQTAKTISEMLPMGDFENLEILRTESKTMLQNENGCLLLVGLENNTATVPS